MKFKFYVLLIVLCLITGFIFLQTDKNGDAYCNNSTIDLKKEDGSVTIQKSLIVSNNVDIQTKLIEPKEQLLNDKDTNFSCNNNFGEDIDYKYKNDPDYNYDDFIGMVTEHNILARDTVYRKINQEIAMKHAKKGTTPTLEDISLQFDNAIDRNFGIDFNKDVKNDLIKIHLELIVKSQFIDKLFSGGSLPRDIYDNNNQEIHEVYLHKLSEKLSDEEFFALLQIRKDEIPYIYDEVIAPIYEN